MNTLLSYKKHATRNLKYQSKFTVQNNEGKNKHYRTKFQHCY